jgi:hypothetical protein
MTPRNDEPDSEASRFNAALKRELLSWGLWIAGGIAVIILAASGRL